MATINLRNEEIAAVAGSLKEAVVKAALAVGDYAVDVVVRVRGSLNKGEVYTQRVTAAMPIKDMLIAAVKLNGVSIEKFIEQYMASAEGQDTKLTEVQVAELEEIWDRLSAKFVRKCNGKVTFKGTVEQVPVVPAGAIS